MAGLRFLMASVVLFFHTDVVRGPWPNTPLGQLDGHAAVTGFFFVSGYSIAHSIIQKPAGFARRRILRIAPLYYSSLLFSLLPIALIGKNIVTPIVHIHPPSLWEFLGSLVFLQGWLFPTPLLYGQFWSLGVEVFYYCCAPIFRLLDDHKINILIVTSAIVCFALANHPFSASFYFGGPLPYEHMGLNLVRFLWAWLAGFALYRNERSLLVILIAPATCILMGAPQAVFYFLILVLAKNVRLSPRTAALFSYGGELSYPLYLTHWTVFLLIVSYVPGHKWTAPLAWIAALLTAMAFYHLIDKRARPAGKIRFAKAPVSV